MTPRLHDGLRAYSPAVVPKFPVFDGAFAFDAPEQSDAFRMLPYHVHCWTLGHAEEACQQLERGMQHGNPFLHHYLICSECAGALSQLRMRTLLGPVHFSLRGVTA